MKIKIEDRIAIHHFATSRNNTDKRLMTKAEYNELPPVEHPLVRYIPETGQRALFVGSHAGAIIGMSEAEAKPLITELLEFATRPVYPQMV